MQLYDTICSTNCSTNFVPPTTCIIYESYYMMYTEYRFRASLTLVCLKKIRFLPVILAMASSRGPRVCDIQYV